MVSVVFSFWDFLGFSVFGGLMIEEALYEYFHLKLWYDKEKLKLDQRGYSKNYLTYKK